MCQTGVYPFQTLVIAHRTAQVGAYAISTAASTSAQTAGTAAKLCEAVVSQGQQQTAVLLQLDHSKLDSQHDHALLAHGRDG